MEVEVDDRLPVPPYVQLRSQIEHAIRSGALEAGVPLPTVRQLAADLGLAPNTVGRVYRDLEAAGLVVTRGRRGTVVAEGAHPDDDRRAGIAAAATQYLAEVRRLGGSVADAYDGLAAVVATRRRRSVGT